MLADATEARFRQCRKPLVDPERFMLQCIGQAHDAILRFGSRQVPPIAPRTTAVIAIIQHGIAYWAHVGDSRFYLVRNGFIGNPVVTRQARDVFEEIEPDAELFIPQIDREALSVAEEPPFSFSRFLSEGYVSLTPMVRLRLRAFLSDVFAQFQSRDLALDLGTLKQMGLI